MDTLQGRKWDELSRILQSRPRRFGSIDEVITPERQSIMSEVERLLHKWIVGANERLETLGLPAGLIEDSVALLMEILGTDYLEQILLKSTEPVSGFGFDRNPLRTWLSSSLIDSHIVQVLELDLKHFQQKKK